jgi:hypothetical protein
MRDELTKLGSLAWRIGSRDLVTHRAYSYPL